MGARQAVLLTPSKPSGPSQLLFYKQHASVSPLFATLTKTAGVSLRQFLFWNSPPAPRLPRPAPARSPLPLCFHILTNSLAGLKLTTPLFSYNYKLLSKNTRGGVCYLFPHSGARPAPNLCALRVSAFRFLVLRLHLFALRGTKSQNPLLYFQQLAHSSAIRWG